jgi:hypothetical protein
MTVWESYFKIFICLTLIVWGSGSAFGADGTHGALLRQYQQALELYKSHRQLFQQNITAVGAGNGAGGSRQGGELKSDLQLPRLRLSEDNPFASMAERDFQLTGKEENLSKAVNDLFASVNKISVLEFDNTWNDLMSQSLSCEQEIIAFNNELTSLHTDTSRKLTQMIHACDRDGIQTEFQSTYQQFNGVSRIENELFRRADIHTKTICNIKMLLAQNAPKKNLPKAPVAPVNGMLDDAFSRQDIVAQQEQLEREYGLVTSLFAELEGLSNKRPQ